MNFKKNVLLLTVSSLFVACLLVGCGKEEENNTTKSTADLTKTDSLETTTAIPETTMETTTNNPTQEWIDTAYILLMNHDTEGLAAAFKSASDVQTICAEYQDKEWSMDFRPYEFAYLMTTTDGKHLGIVVYNYDNTEFDSNTNQVNFFVSEHESDNYGLDSTGYDDTCAEFNVEDNGTISLGATLFDNHLTRYDNGYESDLGEDDLFEGWHV